MGSRSPKNQFVLNNIHTPTQEFLCKHSGDTQLAQNLFSRTNNETWLGAAWLFMYESDKKLFDFKFQSLHIHDLNIDGIYIKYSEGFLQ